MTSTGQASSLTNMFDPHIYACQSLISGTNSNPTIPSLTNEGQQKMNHSPISSPQKTKHFNAVTPVQTSGTLTPQRKQSQQEDGNLRDISVVAESSGHSEIVTTTHLTQTTGSASSSNNNSRKTSTVSDHTSSENTPENATSKLNQDKKTINESETTAVTSTTPVEHNNPVKQSPVRKLSRFLVSPTVIETANHELVVQEGTHAPASSPQQSESLQPIEMNINEDNYQRMEAPEAELLPQQSIGFRMPETLEQLKIELENITHAHVSTKAKELAQQNLLQSNQDNDDSHEQFSEAQLESGAECQSMEAIGSIATGDNTSVYNSRRTSADMNTNPTDLTSTASGVLEYEENLVSEPVQTLADESGSKTTHPVQQQSIDG